MSEKKKVVIRPLEELEAEMIRVTDKYLIAVTKYDYQVREKGNRSSLAYFGKFANAVSYIRDELIREGLQESRNLFDAVKVFNDADRQFENVVKDVFPEYEVRKIK